MNVLLIIAILGLLMASALSRRISFVDVVIVYFLLLDALNVFVVQTYLSVIYNLLRIATVILFFVFYYLRHHKTFNKYHNKVFLISASFPIIVLISSIIGGVEFRFSLIRFLSSTSSFLVLPLALHHYSTNGSIERLLRSIFYFIFLYALSVSIFTILKIDIKHDSFATFTHMGTETFGGGFFYFGNMARLGAITYSAFALLLIPLLYNRINLLKRSLLLFSTLLIVAILMTALKRFTLVAIILGLVFILFSGDMSIRMKIKVVFSVVSISVFLIYFTNITDLVKERYRMRQSLFEIDIITDDIRFFEPIYVVDYIFKGSLIDIFFGKKTEREMDIHSSRHVFYDWKVHNQHAQYLLMYGISGLFAYFFIIYFLYKKTNRMKKLLIKNNIIINDYWFTFQSFLFVFLVAGFAGENMVTTSMVLFFYISGGISGYFLKLLREKNLQVNL